MSAHPILRNGLCVLVAVVGISAASAADSDERLAMVRRAKEMAEIRLRQFERVEYPLTLRRIENEIKLSEAELAVQKQRIREYGENSVFKYSEAFFVTLQEAKLAALRAELHIDSLKSERLLLEQNRSDRCRLLQLEIDAADDELRMLERRK